MFICIPSGQRHEKLKDTLEKWKPYPFKIIGYAWDMPSFQVMKDYCFTSYLGNRESFAVLQNWMFDHMPDQWRLAICGSDDLHPLPGIEKLEKIIDKVGPKVLWVYDNINESTNTHPIITRGWYDKNKKVFDEEYEHNCCDRDLMVRNLMENDLIKVDGISFLHDHPLKTPLHERDVVYQLGYRSLKRDSRHFRNKFKKRGHRIQRRYSKTIKHIEV